jgi:endothelin-converting enzyme
MTSLMGYPDKLPVNVTDAAAVVDYYKGVNISESFFDNNLAFAERATRREWARLGKPYDTAEWHMTPQTVNAYNDPNSNQIAFPAAILQAPYFNVDLPSYLNYAVTGMTAGHEISHGFDYHGREFGADGAFGESWWTNKTDAEYIKRSDCFVQQYNNFTVEGLDGKPLHVNGRQTLDENIADAGGVDSAFLAWKQYVKDRGTPDEDLPGLEGWSHDQLFFLAYANSWCGNARPRALVQQIYGDVHSPSQFRVTGPVMNSRYFRETFQCASKEPTCKIW